MSNKELRTEIKEAIKEARPNLSQGSLATYTSMLSSLAKNQKADSIENLKKLKEKDVMKYVDNMSNKSSQKTFLASIFLLTQNENYQKKMISLANDVNKQYRKQTVSESRKDSYLSPEQVRDRFELAKTNLKSSPTQKHYMEYLITALMSGVFPTIEPRRLEWASVKVKNYNEATDNYLKKNTVHFNQYKTAKKHGKQSVVIHKEIMSVMKRWLKINSSDYLFVTATGRQMSSSLLSKTIGDIYGNEKIGVDILRSIFLSNIYKDVPSLEFLQKTADRMGHSITSAMSFYNKKDIKTD